MVFSVLEWGLESRVRSRPGPGLWLLFVVGLIVVAAIGILAPEPESTPAIRHRLGERCGVRPAVRACYVVAPRGRIAQLARALPRHGRGPRFKSVYALVRSCHGRGSWFGGPEPWSGPTVWTWLLMWHEQALSLA